MDNPFLDLIDLYDHSCNHWITVLNILMDNFKVIVPLLEEQYHQQYIYAMFTYIVRYKYEVLKYPRLYDIICTKLKELDEKDRKYFQSQLEEY